MPDRRARVGIVGAGNRVKRIYLPIFQALQEEFEVVGLTGRSHNKSRPLADEHGIGHFADAPSMASGAKPDFMLVAISPDAIDAVMPSLVTLETPLLVETPFSWKVQTGRRLLKSVKTRQLAVGVAEQTPYLPLEQLKRRLIELGLVGRVVAAINDFAVYDYHGIAALRAYIGSYRDAVRVNAVQSRFPMDVDPARPQVQTRSERWLQGTVLYNDGTLLAHNYSNEYFDEPFRAPRSLRVYGTSGSIVDDTLLFGHDRVEKIQRELLAGRLASLVVETPLGPVRWKNPFASFAFSDEQIAVASLLQNMKLVVHSAGAPAYSAADALQDIEILEAMIRSSERGGAPIRMPLNATYHAFRSLPDRAIDKFRRVAARRRPAS